MKPLIRPAERPDPVSSPVERSLRNELLHLLHQYDSSIVGMTLKYDSKGKLAEIRPTRDTKRK